MIHFLTNNKVLNADLSLIEGSPNIQFPLSNIQHDFTTKVYRSIEGEQLVEILVDLKQVEEIDSIACVGSSTDFSFGYESLKVYGSASTDFSSSAEIEVDLSDKHNNGYVLLEQSQSFRYWKFIFASDTHDPLEVSKLYMGKRTTLANNDFETNSFNYSISDNLNVSENRYGQRFIDRFNSIKSMNGMIMYALKEEFELIEQVWEDHGSREPLWLVLDDKCNLATDGNFRFSGYFYIDQTPLWVSSGPGLKNVSLFFREAK